MSQEEFSNYKLSKYGLLLLQRATKYSDEANLKSSLAIHSFLFDMYI